MAVFGGRAGCDDGYDPAACYADGGGTMAVARDGRLTVAAPDPARLHLFVVDLTTGRARRVSHAECDAMPAWSPDGRSLALIHRLGDVDLVEPDSGSRRRVRGANLAYSDLQWTPDGRTLVYGVQYLDGFPGDPVQFVAAVPAAGGKERRLYADARFPALSPDGRRIAFTDAATNTMFVAVFAGGRGRKILNREGMSRLAWSPDGRWIAFHDRTGISLTTPSGTQTRTLVRRGDADDPVWLPDSRTVLYSDAKAVCAVRLPQADPRPILALAALGSTSGQRRPRAAGLC